MSIKCEYVHKVKLRLLNFGLLWQRTKCTDVDIRCSYFI